MRIANVRSTGAVALAMALFMSSFAAVAAEKASGGVEPETRLVGVVNVNSASEDKLELLPTIGPARARAIVEYRKAHGPFENVEDLIAVSGIGDRAMERIRPHCVLEGKTTVEIKR